MREEKFRQAQEAYLRERQEKERQRKATKAAAFAARLSKLTNERKIASLRKQLANPRTPKQFVPSITARLAALTEGQESKI